MRQRWLVCLFLLLFVAGAKKQPKSTVRFHTEGNARDTEVFSVPATLMYPPREAFLSKVADISEMNVVSIYPFPAADGTMGCAFQLDTNGRIALETLSVNKRGSSLVAFVGGRQVVDMQVDQKVTDGIVTIPRGLAPAEIQALEKRFKDMGKKKRKR